MRFVVRLFREVLGVEGREAGKKKAENGFQGASGDCKAVTHDSAAVARRQQRRSMSHTQEREQV